jgi:uncharacterized membrane-anchored protein YjiN (DUF445 family)
MTALEITDISSKSNNMTTLEKWELLAETKTITIDEAINFASDNTQPKHAREQMEKVIQQYQNSKMPKQRTMIVVSRVGVSLWFD